MSAEAWPLFKTLGIIAVAAFLAWFAWGLIALLAVLALGAVVVFYLGFRQPRQDAAVDRSSDPSYVGNVPNVPIAEMVVDELDQEGIEAFYKVQGALLGSSVTSPWARCAIYVAQRDADAARLLFPAARKNASARAVQNPVETSPAESD